MYASVGILRTEKKITFSRQIQLSHITNETRKISTWSKSYMWTCIIQINLKHEIGFWLWKSSSICICVQRHSDYAHDSSDAWGARNIYIYRGIHVEGAGKTSLTSTRLWDKYDSEVIRRQDTYTLYFMNVRPSYAREVTVFPLAKQPRSSLCRPVLRFLDHTQLDTRARTHPVGLQWTTDQLFAEAATYTTHYKHQRQTSMLSAEFETAIPVNKRLQT
jgi:hypothetical protein